MATCNPTISRINTIILCKTPKSRTPIHIQTLCNFLSTKKPLKSPQFIRTRLNSLHSHTFPENPPKPHFILETIILLIFTLTLLLLRCISNVLLPDFVHRWNHLITFSEEAETKFNDYPSELWQSIVAYEDRRFFSHFGVDPVGISRAMLSLSALGGGSTITQQLVKNIFLKNERTFFRKVVEMALALERKISKLKILSSYMSKIYWGHGVYGIEAASDFYFGKRPSLLSLGECALLAGIIPAPELRSPFKDSSRGKIYQARVLKRLVEVGFQDVETALLVIRQSLHLRSFGTADEILFSKFSPELAKTSDLVVQNNQERERCSIVEEVWDWQRESKIWEVKEEFERWANNKKAQNLINKREEKFTNYGPGDPPS